MKYLYFIFFILLTSILSSCNSSPTNKLKRAVEKMEKISLNEISEKNLEEFEAQIHAIVKEIEYSEVKLSPEETKKLNYWMGRYYALKVKIAFYPIRFLGENIIKFAEGFLNGLGVDTSEMEEGLKDGLRPFENIR